MSDRLQELSRLQPARAQADALVHDAQAELAAIRRDLAAARIATSKQEGEAAELRRNITVQETDRTKIKKILEQALAPTVNGVHLDPSGTTKFDRTNLQADMKELKARMVSLTDEQVQMKQHFSS